MTIPIATVVEDAVTYKLDKILNQVKDTNSALTGLNVLNVLGLQRSVNGLGEQISRVENFNNGMDKLIGHVETLNNLLTPLSNMANEKMLATQHQVKLNEKIFMLDLAKMAENNPRVLDTYNSLMNSSNHYYMLGGIAVGLAAGICIAALFNKDKKRE